MSVTLKRLQKKHKEQVERLAELVREYDILTGAIEDAQDRGDYETAANWNRNLADCEWEISNLRRQM